MRTKKKAQPLTEREIDNIVVTQADDDAAWGKPVRVGKTKTASVPLSSALATRVAFFARLHREKSMEAWLERIIQERLDLEESERKLPGLSFPRGQESSAPPGK